MLGDLDQRDKANTYKAVLRFENSFENCGTSDAIFRVRQKMIFCN